jgi:RNA polymerase sigma-70 factor (ECF subfamily)
VRIARPRRPLPWHEGSGAPHIGPEQSHVEQPAGGVDDVARNAVDSVLAGDGDAFRQLVERESGAVVRTCYRILGSLPDAEDAAQEAFVTAYRALGTWRGDGPFAAWLRRIAVRCALQQAKRPGTRQLPWSEPLRKASETTDPPNRSVTLEPVDPIDPLDGWEQATLIRAAVADLDEPYREVVALRFFAGLSLAEIAAATGRPVPTIKTHLRRGLIRLRDELGDLR